MIIRISNLVWKELLQLARDWLLTAFLFLLPMLQLVLLARATGRGIKEQPLVVLDMDRSAVTRELVLRMDRREELALVRFVADERSLAAELERGTARVAVIFPSGFAVDLSDPTRTASVRVVVDGSSDTVASIVQSAVETVFADYIRQYLRTKGFHTDPPVDLRVVTYYNPAYDVRQFTIPAQVGFIVYQITLVIASLGLARERELGTLEALIVTPLSRTEIVLGKAIPAFLIGGVNFLFLVAIARFGFHVPMRGSFLLLLALTVPFLLAEIGWGVIISSISRTQQQAILFVFIMAMIDLTFSGYLMPVKNLSPVLGLISRAVPMYHYLTIIRAVMLKGAGPGDLGLHGMALVLLAAVILLGAVHRVSQRLD
ncbi:MAG: ABC transporter permease [Anaerolineae bacterium]|nr:ABC transporter permease [Anaerolineae bacterium]MDW8068498.1 ABC transporter permease [Anaerolineae bacterium]